jgi:hypothetical protein
MLALVLGIGLRAYHADSLGETVYEWEADGFVMALEGRGWDSINRVRPAGMGLTLDRLSSALGVTTLLEVRWVCVGLSILALMAALDLAVAASRVTGMTRRSIGRAMAWGTMAWAVHPTLVRSAVSPTPGVLLGGGLCLALAGLARCRGGSWVLGCVLFCLGCSLAVVVGGSVVALALSLGLLVYLVPVPRLPAALAAMLAVGLALGAGAMAQRGPAGMQREWLPDTAPAHSLLALTETPAIYPSDVSFHAEERELESFHRALSAVAAAPPVDLAVSLAARLGKHLAGPRRLTPLLLTAIDEPLGDEWLSARRGLGLFDVLMRGGLLLFALAVLGLTRRKEVMSSWPRAGIVVAALVLLLVGAATAVGPLALAALDLVLLGAAAAGVAGADPARPWTRRLAFGVGGTLLCTLLITGGVDDTPIDPWLQNIGHNQREGEQLALLMQHGGPTSLIDELRACHLLSRPQAPFLRRPRLAMAHALAATLIAPDSDDAVVALISSQAECGLYREAAMMAESAHTASPSGTEQSRRMELMLDWVVKEQRDAGLR